MRIGIIAPEFPPQRGGMEEHARMLVAEVAREYDVCLITRPGSECDHSRVTVVPGFTGYIGTDAELAAAQDVDCWLALSAGTAALIPHLSPPAFAYVHGVDGLRPWLPAHYRLDRLARLLTNAKLPGGAAMVDRWRCRRIREGLRAARGLFANSEATAAAIARAHALNPSAFKVVHPGVDARFLTIARAPRGEEIRFLSVSRLSDAARRKNIDGVLEALSLVRDEFAFEYHIVGDGNDRQRLEQKAYDLGLSKRVEFTGALDAVEIERQFGWADLFILAVKPSPVDVEGFGMVYAEAACAGLPSLGVDNGGVREALEDGVSGILLPEASADLIVAGLRRFVVERALFDQQRLRAYGRARTAPVTSQVLLSAIEAAL